ncbi:MAG: ABC transporter permease [Rhodocyclaceae bacterium]|nr:ABC transporter permease [Rhodocyclaceae bacterium]
MSNQAVASRGNVEPGAAQAPALRSRPAAPASSRFAVGGGRHAAIKLASVAAFIALWQWLSSNHVDLKIITFANIPAPSDVAPAFLNLLESPKLAAHIGNSLWRVFAGFIAAAALGIGLGLIVGRSRWVADILMPPLEILRPIPGVAWIPVAILAFPSSEASMIFITFMGALFPVLLNTIHGVESVDPRLIATARSLGAKPLSIFLEVILPSATPSITTGLAIGMGTAWFCLVTAEMISGEFGIGYFTWESYSLQNYADILVGMVFIGAFGMLSSVFIKQAGRALTPWLATQEKQH